MIIENSFYFWWFIKLSTIFNTLLLIQHFYVENHRLIWFPGWLKIDLFVRSNEERLRWQGIPPDVPWFTLTRITQLGTWGAHWGPLLCQRGVAGMTGGSDDGRALASHSLQSVTWHWHGALTWHGAQSHWESGDCRDWGPRLGHGCMEDRQQIVITMKFWILN